MSNDDIVWKVGSPMPIELENGGDPFSDCLVPRKCRIRIDDERAASFLVVPHPLLAFDMYVLLGMIAWLSVDNENVALLEGYSGCAYTPPSLFFASSAIPVDFLEKLKETKVCTISNITVRDSPQSIEKAYSWPAPTSHKFSELGLLTNEHKKGFPCAVASSPIQMFCSLENFVELDDEGKESIIVLVVESFFISKSVLSPPTEEMKKRPNVVAKIDAALIQPVVSLGGGKICRLKNIHSMPRPVKAEDGMSWTSTDFDLASPSLGEGNFQSVEWNFREHGGTSPLGYNAVTALLMPRPIGWISTYHTTADGQRLSHLAPYSFFSNVSRSMDNPMVAFSGYRKDNGATPKDAQNDAEKSKCFSYNMVTQELAVQMNLSAAELPREGSEFELSGLRVKEASFVETPTVEDSPVRFECQYVKSVPIGSFSIVVGKVVAVSVHKRVITDKRVDPSKLKPITRMGFMDEYGSLEV